MIQQRLLTPFARTLRVFLLLLFNVRIPGLIGEMAVLRPAHQYVCFSFVSHSVDVKISYRFQLQQELLDFSAMAVLQGCTLCCAGRSCHRHGDPFLQGKGANLQSS